MTHKTIHPESWLPAKGYANGMLDARWCGCILAGRLAGDGDQRFVGV